MEAADLAAVAAWMAGAVPGFEGPLEARKFAMGQSNPTYHLTAPSGAYVLRRKPPGLLLKSAHAVEREFRVQKALRHSAVPVPPIYALCEDDAVIGSAFYIMGYVAGRNFAEPRLAGATPRERAGIIGEMGRVLADLHRVDPAAVGLSDYGPGGAYLERQVARWSKQYRASATEPVPAMDALIDALGQSLPPDDGRRSLVHGDFRIDNLLFAQEGTDCVAVLDWELSTLGHPFADLAGVIMQWRLPPGAEGRGLEGLDRAALGLPSDEAFIAGYCARCGLAGIGDFEVYLAFCFFRMAAILQGVKRRALEGNASNPESGQRLGAFVPLFAAKGLEALEAPPLLNP